MFYVCTPRPLKLARRAAGKFVMPLARSAAKSYTAGDRLEDALKIADHWSEIGVKATLGFWDSENQTPESVAKIYRQTIIALAGSRDYVSIKLPALRYSNQLLTTVAAEAHQRNVRLHFDSLWPETADQTRATIDELLASPACPKIGYTLAARWNRCIDDATWAIDRSLPVRIVKGQWPDPSRDRDLRQGYLDLIDTLAGRARHVAVATHDAPLIAKSLARLRATKTSCELELLHGLPMRRCLEIANDLKVPVRIYLPFGKAHLPYAIRNAVHNPRLIWWLMKDLLGGN